MTWTTWIMDLPVAADKPLMLVPDRWARRWLLMSAGRYYETSVLSWAQDERAVEVDGKLNRPTKPMLRRNPTLGRGRTTITTVTVRAHQDQHHNLVAGFTGFVDEKFFDAQNKVA